MDHESLRTASTYLNNLLQARGLLRNGEPVDFVKPSKESRAQIINLVHDLILREDRDKDRQEHVAQTLRHLRSEDARKTHEIERLTTQNDESGRAAAQAQAAERAAQNEVKKVEKAMKALQDQATKLKTTLAQVKTQCTNDVRKRDLELARLKTHLQGQQRGNRAGMTAPSMTVKKQINHSSAQNLEDPEYSLRQETTEFLTQLSQNLSDENDSLISLIRSALGTLRPLLGIPEGAKKHPDSAMGSMGSEEDINGKQKGAHSMLHALPTSYEALSAEMESTLEQLKTILTNPNFVSMEEVEVREEEIARLREGWDHMEKRWRDVLFMMEGWVKRMNTGDSINIDDLRQGMGLVSPNRERNEEEAEAGDNSLMDTSTSEIRLPDIEEVTEASEIRLSPPDRSTSTKGSPPKRKHDVLEPPTFFDLRPPTNASKSAPPSPPKHGSNPRPVSYSDEAASPPLDDDYESDGLEVPQMTIAEKLSAAQEEAEQAAAAAANARESKGKASRREQVPAANLNGSMDELSNERDDDTLGKMPSPMGKRTKIKGRPKKRKSTLTPDEFASLIVGDD
ncbi:hypothetical protein PRZ48_004969 [Zasmidium cellare]|uniref:NIMA interactive protein n=1 Tax=Zasmidium cellare TaxID=395010 RepID=A0ABR0ER47_ZASCE|nr:hypothetical protein PRZ48_004969 [Zasmidium cellare]